MVTRKWSFLMTGLPVNQLKRESARFRLLIIDFMLTKYEIFSSRRSFGHKVPDRMRKKRILVTRKPIIPYDSLISKSITMKIRRFRLLVRLYACSQNSRSVVQAGWSGTILNNVKQIWSISNVKDNLKRLWATLELLGIKNKDIKRFEDNFDHERFTP